MSNDDVLQMRDAGEQAMGSIEYCYMLNNVFIAGAGC